MEQSPQRQRSGLTPAEAMLRAERRRHRRETDEMKIKITNLELQLSNLSMKFNDVNRKLLANSSVTYDSDQIISETYEDLCQSVKDWVDANCGRVENLAQKIEDGTGSNPDRRDLDRLLDDGATIEIIRSHPRCADFFLSKMILRFLFESVLRQARWIPGMSAEQEKVLQFALDNFHSTFPDRDLASRESWRSDTYKSLSQSPILRASKEIALNNLAAKLLAMVTSLTSNEEKCDKSGLETIVHAAVDLADAMRRCSVQYSFIYAFAPQMPTDFREVGDHVLEKHNLIDIDTGISVHQSTEHSLTGEVLCTVSPTLTKLASDGSVSRLVKGVALAKLAPIGTRSDAKPEGTKKGEDSVPEHKSLKAAKQQSTRRSVPDTKDEKQSESTEPEASQQATDASKSESKKSKQRPMNVAISDAQGGRLTWASVAKM